MKGKIPNQEWLLLIHLLPPQPTNLRVRIWREQATTGKKIAGKKRGQRGTGGRRKRATRS